MAGLVLGGGLVRMIPVRKDWYLGGGNGASIAVFVACQHLLSHITIFKYCSLNDFVV